MKQKRNYKQSNRALIFECLGIMPSNDDLIIFGASVRAAAFSALQAGLRPWCADLFADRDLQARCSVRRLPFRHYPHGFAAMSDQGPPGPWMYTGGLENHPALINRISEKRFLWGNGSAALQSARSPTVLAEILPFNGINFPATYSSSQSPPRNRRWVCKPIKGAGGTGIYFVDSRKANRPNPKYYFQEFVEGIPCSAVYVAYENDARLLGVTRQLVGEAWLRAASFHYCGSVGPLSVDATIQKDLEKIGNVLNRHCHLRGLFGVDFILADGIPWPVEVNPRYPASVGILEYGKGIQSLSWHRSAFDPGAARHIGPTLQESIVGKAILYAKSPLEFPEEGPWTRSISRARPIEELPDFADIPSSGQVIEAGKPILTFFSRSASVEGCIDNLKQIGRELDHCLGIT